MFSWLARVFKRSPVGPTGEQVRELCRQHVYSTVKQQYAAQGRAYSAATSGQQLAASFAFGEHDAYEKAANELSRVMGFIIEQKES